MDKTLEKITIKTGTHNPKLTEKVKELKESKKKARKAFKNAGSDDKKQKLNEYFQAQKKLKEEMEVINKDRVQDRIQKIVEAGGVKSDLFWKIRKKIIQKTQADDEPDTITEDDVTLTDPEQAEEHIANFYSDLYQARPGTEEIQRVDRTHH